MITMALKYKSDNNFQVFLKKLRKQYTSFFHFSYNRLWDGKTNKEIYHLTSSLNNINLIKSRMINDCIVDASMVYDKDKKLNKKSIFGSKKEFIRKCKGLISNESWKDKRLKRLFIQGEVSYYGNRYFKLDLYNNKITFKYDKDHHFDLDIKASRNQLKVLYKLQELIENKKSKYTISLSDKEINISFEEIKSEEKINFKENRFIGIDMNPSNIGVSVCEFDKEFKVLYTIQYNFSEITDKILKENKKLNNKLDYEIYQISKSISNLSKHWLCKNIFIEDLNLKNGIKGKTFNRLTKNIWKRNKFIDNLTKRCNIYQQGIYQVNAAYSSIIGNCQYDYTDPINASIEMARRGFETKITKNKNFYPVVGLKDSLIHRWKEMVNEMPDSWKDLYVLLKNSRMSYRVSLKECLYPFDVFSKKVRMVNIYSFNCLL